MLEFLRPIVKFDTWLYIGLGLTALFFIRIIWLARKDRTRSIFTLERENANARMMRGFLGLMVVLSLTLGVYYLSAITPTIVPPPQETPTPTPIIALPPTPTSPPLPTQTPTLTPTPLPPVEATVESTEQPTATPVPAQVGQAPNCPQANARITQPGDGAHVSGVIRVNGAATGDDFKYYKFEFRAPGGEWSFIELFNNPVINGVLGSWNTATVGPGEYEFRLVVVDTIGNYPEPCVIRLVVE
jgi:hypothetical protein